jgi:hypothetical protein
MDRGLSGQSRVSVCDRLSLMKRWLSNFLLEKNRGRKPRSPIAVELRSYGVSVGHVVWIEALSSQQKDLRITIIEDISSYRGKLRSFGAEHSPVEHSDVAISH